MCLHETRTASTPNIYVKYPAIPSWAASAARANITHPSGQLDFCPSNFVHPFGRNKSPRQLQRYESFCKTKEKRRKMWKYLQIPVVRVFTGLLLMFPYVRASYPHRSVPRVFTGRDFGELFEDFSGCETKIPRHVVICVEVLYLIRYPYMILWLGIAKLIRGSDVGVVYFNRSSSADLKSLSCAGASLRGSL